MKYNEVKDQILSEINGVLSRINSTQLKTAVEYIMDSNKIVVGGAGRMGYAIKSFGMRLGHFGLNAWTLGDSTVPYTQEGDLVIVASGSGNTGTMRIIAEKAKEHGAFLIVVTCNRDSAIGKLADFIIDIPAQSSLTGSQESIQPMKTYVEQSTLILYDIMSLMLLEKMPELSDEGTLSKCHSILE